jgi:dipeptidyl aminopeptidase/acylaminoacyl peptidase
MHQYQMLAARGYAVFYANITGSTGYGEGMKLPFKERWGGRDWDDVLPFLDHVLAEFPVDPKRVAIAGGSYGGYMVNWAIGHTDRYAAAVSERGVSDMVAHQGDGDTALLHTGFDLPMDEHAYKNFARFWDMSPLKYIRNAKTPTLIVCAEDDLRVPSSQMDNLYTALKLQKVDVRMLRFPEADHTFYTDGSVKQRIYWMNAIADWLDEHLQEQESKQNG